MTVPAYDYYSDKCDEMEARDVRVATPITDALDAQGSIEPGQEGWWEVWGACVSDIRAGDMYMSKQDDDSIVEELVVSLEPYEPGDLRESLRLRYRNADGELLTIGRLHRIVLLRRGTRHTLSESAR